MAILDDAFNVYRRGLRAAGGALSGLGGVDPAAASPVPPSAGGAAPPVSPATPQPSTPPGAQGVRGATAQEARALGGASPEAAAYQASRAAPIAPAASVGDAAVAEGAAGSRGFQAGRAAAQGLRAAGKVVGLDPSNLQGARRFAAGSGLALAGIQTAGDVQGTDTSKYANRFGVADSGGFDDSTLGRLQEAGRDVTLRTAGAVTDLGANVLDGVGSVVNGVRGAFGARPLQSFKDRLDNGTNEDGLASDPSPQPTPNTPATTPSTSGPFDFQTQLRAGQLAGNGFGTGQPSNVDPTPVAAAPAAPGIGPDGLPIGIRRTGNSFTNIGPDGSLGATGQLPNTGFDLGAANDIQARANAIRASGRQSAPGDENTLFNGVGSGRATATGTPQGSEPRMQVSGGSIGDLVTQKFANRRTQLDQQQQELGLRRGDQLQRNAQFGAELGLHRDQLSETARQHNNTIGIQGAQLQREGLRDQSTAQFQRGELANKQRQTDVELAKFGAEHDLALKKFGNEQDQQKIKTQADANKNLEDTLGSILPRTKDDKGNSVVDANAVQSHRQDINATVAAMVRDGLSSSDPQKQAFAKDLQERGPQALGPDGLQNLVDLKAIKDRTFADKGILPGSANYVDSQDLRAYAPKKTSGTLYDTTSLANGSSLRSANLRRQNPSNLIFPDIGNPSTDRFNYLGGGIRRGN